MRSAFSTHAFFAPARYARRRLGVNRACFSWSPFSEHAGFLCMHPWPRDERRAIALTSFCLAEIGLPVDSFKLLGDSTWNREGPKRFIQGPERAAREPPVQAASTPAPHAMSPPSPQPRHEPQLAHLLLPGATQQRRYLVSNAQVLNLYSLQPLAILPHRASVLLGYDAQLQRRTRHPAHWPGTGPSHESFACGKEAGGACTPPSTSN